MTTVPVYLAGWQLDSSPSAFQVGDTVDWVLGFDTTSGPLLDDPGWSATLPVIGRFETEQGPKDTETVLASDGTLSVYVCVPHTLNPTAVTIGIPENDRHEQIAPPQARTTRLVVQSMEMTVVDHSQRESDGRLAATLKPVVVCSASEALEAAGPYLHYLLVTCVV